MSHLRTHVRTIHDGIKEHQCGLCDNVFGKSELYYKFKKNIQKNYINIFHSALKLEKKCNFKSTKTHFLRFKKWQKINFGTRKKFKTTKNAIFGLFSGAKIDFLPFLKMQIMCFCTFEIALFSNFRALWIM